MSKPRTYNHTSTDGASIGELHPELDAQYYQRQRSALEAEMNRHTDALVVMYNETYDHAPVAQSSILRRSLMAGLLFYLDTLRVATEHVNFLTGNISGATTLKRIDVGAARRHANKETKEPAHDSASRPYPH